MVQTAVVARIPVPINDDRFDATVSMDGSMAAFASLDHTVVTAGDGTIHWQRESAITPQGQPRSPAVHIDRAGHLWLYGPDGDHIAVIDAQTGDEIDRKALSSSIGAGKFVAHPDGVHLGLSVAQGQDGTNSYWLAVPRRGCIVMRELPGETLAAVAYPASTISTLPHVDTQLTIRRFVDDHVIASCAADEIPGSSRTTAPASTKTSPTLMTTWAGRAGRATD